MAAYRWYIYIFFYPILFLLVLCVSAEDRLARRGSSAEYTEHFVMARGLSPVRAGVVCAGAVCYRVNPAIPFLLTSEHLPLLGETLPDGVDICRGGGGGSGDGCDEMRWWGRGGRGVATSRRVVSLLQHNQGVA